MTKDELRNRFKQERGKLSPPDRAERSRRIINQFFEVVDWNKIQSLHAYLPLEKQNEVDTLPLLRAARQQNPNLKIATAWRDGIEVKTSWLDGEFEKAQPVKPGFRFGLIIVPMLGFDSRGYRLGYGGGFYDQFLPTQPDALIIGLCYEFGHLKNLPHEAHDVPLDMIVTEKLIYRF